MSEEVGKNFLTNIPIPLYIISITLHITGIFLLTTQRSRRRNQDIIILNLSICELWMSICDLVQNILMRSGQGSYIMKSQGYQYLILVQCTFFVLPSLLFMIVLTVDRFFEVYLNIRYYIYFSRKKVTVIIVVCWLVGMLLAVTLFAWKWKRPLDATSVIYQYLLPTVEGVFLIIAATTYSYIYKKYRSGLKCPRLGKVIPNVVPIPLAPQKLYVRSLSSSSASEEIIPPKVSARPLFNRSISPTTEGTFKTKSTPNNSSTTNVDILDSECFNIPDKKPSTLKKRSSSVFRKFSTFSQGIVQRAFRRKRVIRKQNFFVPSLIIVTFVLFVIVPDTLNLFLFYISKQGTSTHSNVLLIMYALGFIADATIYIFLQKQIRNSLFRKLHIKACIDDDVQAQASLSVGYTE